MGDPLFANGLNLAVWLILILKAVVVFVLVLVSVVFMVMYERKAVAQLGVRYGPNRAGPNGWFQSVADGTKLLFKEAFTPRGADKVVYGGYYPFGIELERTFAQFDDVPFKDEVWPKFLRENARKVLKLDR